MTPDVVWELDETRVFGNGTTTTLSMKLFRSAVLRIADWHTKNALEILERASVDLAAYQVTHVG